MTAPSRARRHAATVEVMRLNSESDLDVAEEWLATEGVSTRRGFQALWLHVPDRAVLPARLGQVLTFDPDLREFAVLDAAVYDKTHTSAQGVAE